MTPNEVTWTLVIYCVKARGRVRSYKVLPRPWLVANETRISVTVTAASREMSAASEASGGAGAGAAVAVRAARREDMPHVHRMINVSLPTIDILEL